MALVEASEYMNSPTYPIVKLKGAFVDERGAIQNLTTNGSQSTAVITSKAGSERASHVHRQDDHLSWVVSGRIEYWWQDLESVSDDGVVLAGTPKSVVVEAGQAFYTPALLAHTMYFPVDTTFVTISCKRRERADHEADLIRVPSLKTSDARSER